MVSTAQCQVTVSLVTLSYNCLYRPAMVVIIVVVVIVVALFVNVVAVVVFG